MLQSDCVSSVFHQVVNAIIGSMKQVQNSKNCVTAVSIVPSSEWSHTYHTLLTWVNEWEDSGCAQKPHVDSTSMIKSPDFLFIHINKWRLDRISFLGKLWQSLLSQGWSCLLMSPSQADVQVFRRVMMHPSMLYTWCRFSSVSHVSHMYFDQFVLPIGAVGAGCVTGPSLLLLPAVMDAMNPEAICEEDPFVTTTTTLSR